MQSKIDPEEISLELMRLSDIDEVLKIEGQCFSNPWSRRAFKRELTKNRYAIYFLARKEAKALGYIGGWLVLDEAHITTLAVAAQYRQRGVAQFLLDRLLNRFLDLGVEKVTLEVRVSNNSARNLYTKHGFAEVGIKEQYYQDNQEDAVIMWKQIKE